MGLYIHIPFCRSKCFYCGFYSVASLKWKEAYLKALLQEMEVRGGEEWTFPLETIYFGGGTPSFLDCSELELILDKVEQVWGRDGIVETSIEANPEDVTKEKMDGFRQLGFNRLTIGVQSFDDRILKRINRTHSAVQAYRAVETAKASGFDNIGVDLIIGLPGSDIRQLEEDLKTVKSLDIDHISVYILSLDSNSVFEKLSVKGKYQPLNEDELVQQYLWASSYLKNAGYEHYEISNFAKNFKYSKHNTSYWQQKPYLGVGAAAHSYDLNHRQWNVSHLKRYIDGLNDGVLYSEKELLTDENKFNEYMMTNLRTMWGIDLLHLQSTYPKNWESISSKLLKYEAQELARRQGNRWRLTEAAWLISDDIFVELFM